MAGEIFQLKKLIRDRMISPVLTTTVLSTTTAKAKLHYMVVDEYGNSLGGWRLTRLAAWRSAAENINNITN